MEEFKKRFQKLFPEVFFLSYSIKEVEHFLRARDWLGSDEPIIALSKPGEGNMNFVLRITTPQRSFIVKQARPWVEKYPSIDAPVERNGVEAMFLKAVNRDPVLKDFSPVLLGVAPDAFIMVIEDLGESADHSSLYGQEQEIDHAIRTDLAGYLSRLHRIDAPEFPANLDMRRLNHEHIFRFPFAEENGLNLDEIQPGLQEASLPYKRNNALKKEITRLGELYLAPGPTLIHGDFYPGSWLWTDTGLKIIDAEFAFKGYAEFDLGVFAAHLTMAGQSTETIEAALSGYDRKDTFDDKLMWGFAGTEILRRLIGIAQLPLSLDVRTKIEIMDAAAAWILKE